MPKSRKVTCPDCGQKDVEIYGEGTGTCPTCDLNVQAVYEQARHQAALKKIQQSEPEPEPTPTPKPKKQPFDFKL